MWRSMGRPPMAQPPGMATRAMPVRAMSGPRTSELARMVLTISYLATGSERMRAADAGAMLGAAVAEFDFGAHAGEELALGLDVADLGDVFEDDFVFGEDGGGHAGEGGVFCSGDFDGAEKRVAAAYYELVHLVSLRRFCVEMSSCAGTGVIHVAMSRNERRDLDTT